VSAMAIGWTVFACLFGGALLGMFLRAVLPEHHLSVDSKDLVKLGMGLVATMSALVLGLLIASAKSSYDGLSNDLTQISANLILLDHVMAHYGPETKAARELLRRSVDDALARLWPGDNSRTVQLEPLPRSEDLYDKIHELSLRNQQEPCTRASGDKCREVARHRLEIVRHEDPAVLRSTG
jgi:hypothetical protein